MWSVIPIGANFHYGLATITVMFLVWDYMDLVRVSMNAGLWYKYSTGKMSQSLLIIWISNSDYICGGGGESVHELS